MLKSSILNVREEAKIVLQTILLLDEKYGPRYLIQVLQGNETYALSDPEHKQLAIFGKLSNWSSDRIKNLFRFLIQQDLVEVTHQSFGCLGLTEKGFSFIEESWDLSVAAHLLRTSPRDRRLVATLRRLRFQLAQKAQCAPYQIFTDFTLDHLVEKKPTDLQSLKAIPGMGDFRAERFGAAILLSISQVIQGHLPNAVASPHSNQPRSQEFVNRNLLALEKAGKLDLNKWIEGHLAPEVLQKGSRFFQEHQEAPLREAYEALGLDYTSLRLCRLYVSQVRSSQEELRVA